MKHIFIVNSISGKGKGLKSVDIIKEACEELSLDYKIILTKYPGHAIEIAKKYKPQDNVTLYSVGGDGTILEILNGMDNRIPLGAIPGGSGEDFIRYFHVDSSNLKQYIIQTIKADPISIDVGQTNRMKYINTTSFGIDATINFDASRMIRKTKITKGPAYGLSIIKNGIGFKPLKLKMIVDNEKLDDNYMIVSCMNGKYYGNGICSAPNSDMQDGHFDLVLIKRTTLIKTYFTLILYLLGQGNKTKNVIVKHAKHVIVDCDEIMNIQSDGENYEANHLEIEILPSYLKLKIPATK